jgi:hypothetical protein
MRIKAAKNPKKNDSKKKKKKNRSRSNSKNNHSTATVSKAHINSEKDILKNKKNTFFKEDIDLEEFEKIEAQLDKIVIKKIFRFDLQKFRLEKEKFRIKNKKT